jgi:SAM-dependent methyltransferase
MSRIASAGRHQARRLWGAAIDLAETATGRRKPLTPPRRLLTADYSEFDRIGAEFLRYFVELGGLEPGHRVLDVGCGVGRMAVPLTRYIAGGGAYEGFDVAAKEVAWCERNISARNPSFRFRHVDLHNARYHPAGRLRPAEFAWPYADASFDFALATSVFTHMRQAGADRYLAEIARVLRPGGRLFATYFALDDRARRLIAAGRSRYSFQHGEGPAWSDDPRVFESAVAYDLDFLRARHAEHGIPIEAFHRGGWSGAEPQLTWQDVTISLNRKTGDAAEKRS